MNHWTILNINPSRDPQVVRRGYLSQLLSEHPGDNPESFHTLREAYEDALDDILKQDIDDDFSLIDLYADSENDPTPITPTFAAVEADAGEKNSVDLDSLKQFEAKAAHYVEKLVERLSFENQQSANYYLEELLKLPDLNDLILRAAFERLLQRSLTLVVPFPTVLAKHVYQLFGWREKLKQPHDCYLAAIDFLIQREGAYDRIDKLEDLGAKRLARRGRVARALLSDYDPLRFWRMALRRSNIEEAKIHLNEIDKIAPKLLPFILDPRTVRWWRNAVQQRRLYIKDYLAAASIATVISFLLVVFDKIFVWRVFHTKSQFVLTGLTLFIGIVIVMLINIRLKKNNVETHSAPATRPAKTEHDADAPPRNNKKTQKKNNWREPVSDYFEHASEKIDLRNRFHMISVSFVVAIFALTLVTKNEMLNVFAIISYLSLVIVFGVSLFFYFNFAAMFVRFLLEDHEWFMEIAFYSKMQIHTFCVFDMILSFIVLNLIMQMTCKVLKYPLGISNLQIMNRPMYELILIIAILVLHVMFLLPN